MGPLLWTCTFLPKSLSALAHWGTGWSCFSTVSLSKTTGRAHCQFIKFSWYCHWLRCCPWCCSKCSGRGFRRDGTWFPGGWGTFVGVFLQKWFWSVTFENFRRWTSCRFQCNDQEVWVILWRLTANVDTFGGICSPMSTSPKWGSTVRRWVTYWTFKSLACLLIASLRQITVFMCLLVSFMCLLVSFMLFLLPFMLFLLSFIYLVHSFTIIIASFVYLLAFTMCLLGIHTFRTVPP